MMFKSHLKTQPLDPSVLQGLEKKSPGERGAASATTPLYRPEMQLDHIQAQPLATGVPAQGISLSTPPALSSEEAELLLSISEKLGNLYKSDRNRFHLAMQALQTITAQGDVDFSQLTPQQQSLLASLGLTAQNTAQVYQQLYQLLLPTQQNQSSNAFQVVQSSITQFISNVDLREKAFTQIETQARDLSRIQGVVSSLSANSINNLLADQTAGVYDLAVSKITSQNFNLQSGMDYTLGHFVVLSQESPATLQQIETILQKIQMDQELTLQDRQLLNRYGLNVTAENKLETLDRKPLSLQEVQLLESVVFSMKDPSEGYARVLAASADVIKQSKKLEELSRRASFEVAQVQKTSTEVETQNQVLQLKHQQTNQLNARLQAAQSQAQQLQIAVQSATGLGRDFTLDISPLVLAQWNIRIENSPQGPRFYIGQRRVSQLELMSHLGYLLQQQQQYIQQMAGDLARQKSETLKATADLAQTTQKLQMQTEQLAQTRREIQQETLKLQDLELTRLEVIRQESPRLKPEELNLVQTALDPLIIHTVQRVQTHLQTLDRQIDQTLQQAHQTIATSQTTQELVQRDILRWEQTLAQIEDLERRLRATLDTLDKIARQQDMRQEKTDEEIQFSVPAHIQSPPSLLPEEIDFDSATVRLKQTTQRKAEQRIQQDHAERRRLNMIQAEERERKRQSLKRAQRDEELFQMNLQRLKHEN